MSPPTRTASVTPDWRAYVLVVRIQSTMFSSVSFIKSDKHRRVQTGPTLDGMSVSAARVSDAEKLVKT